MHEIKLVFAGQKEVGKTKLLHITDLFEYPIEILVPSNCIGLKVYKGDAIDCILLQDLTFIEDDNADAHLIVNNQGKIVGTVEE